MDKLIIKIRKIVLGYFFSSKPGHKKTFLNYLDVMLNRLQFLLQGNTTRVYTRTQYNKLHGIK